MPYLNELVDEDLGSLGAPFRHVTRFGLTEDAFGAELYANLWSRAHVASYGGYASYRVSWHRRKLDDRRVTAT